MNNHHISLEFNKVLENLSKYATSLIAKKECLNLPLYTKKAQIDYELNLVSQARKIIDDTQQYLPIGEITDIEECFKNNFLTAEEIFEITKNLTFARLSKNYISKNNSDELSEISNSIYTNKELEDKIYSIFDSELNIKDEASNELKSLRNSLRDNKDNLKGAISNLLLNNSFLNNLQDTVVSTRDNRPVFQVKASCKNKVQGIIHDVSSTNLTFFIEPTTLIPLSNKIRQIEIQIQTEIDRILLSLSNQFKELTNELMQNQKILARLDLIFAKARYAIHLKASQPDIVEDKIIDIQGMLHPLLIEIKDEIIPNDFQMGIDYDCLLITGANTGGKTVAIKTLGLMVLMAKAGLHIPCLGAKIYPYKDIYCDISTEQSLEQGISTFGAHIKNISDILENIDENSLVLLDELGSGTDPTEGSYLSRAIIEYIINKHTNCVITTHLGELKSLKYELNRVENASVLFDNVSLQPKYSLIIGVSGTSNAIDISSKLGLNPEIIKRAKEVMQNSSNNSSVMFAEIEKTSQNLLQKEKETEEELEKTKEIKQELEEKLKDIKKQKKKSLDSFKRKFQSGLDNARDEIKEIVDEIRKEKSLKVAMRSYNRLNNIENKIREDFSKHDDELSEKYKELNTDKLKIGQSVLIKKLNQIAILDSLPDKKNKVKIRLGNIQSVVKLDELAYTDKKVAQHLKKVTVNFNNEDNLLSRLDLRGMRAQEAIEYLDEKLDKASLKGLGQMSVIHGYGTGALKKAVYDYLKTSPYIAKFRYGDETEGRDGVVIIDLL